MGKYMGKVQVMYVSLKVSFIFLQKCSWLCTYIIWNKRDNSPLFLHSPPLWEGKALWRADSTLELAMFCGSSLDRAWRIFDGMLCVYQGHDSILRKIGEWTWFEILWSTLLEPTSSVSDVPVMNSNSLNLNCNDTNATVGHLMRCTYSLS